MKKCVRCDGFVPEAAVRCPNCRSTRRWWAIPLSILGAGAASVTLSACYGPACATKLPDGGYDYGNANCVGTGYDCTTPLIDGGDKTRDPEWLRTCERSTTDAGKDAGADGGADGGSDAGP
jgi:hypothetical protein